MASSRKIANVYAELSVKDRMSVGLKSAKKSLADFGSSAKAAASNATIALGAATVAGTALAAVMGAGTKKALDMGGALSDVSAATGINVASVMKLERAYADGGIAASRMGGDIAKMQKAIMTAATGGKDPFSSMGLSAKELLAMDPAAQFQAIGDAIQRIENPTERNAKAMEVFGKSGAKLMTVFGQFEGAARDLGKMPELAEQFAASFDRASDIIGNLPSKSDQFFVGFTSGIISQLLPALEDINQKDFTELGQNVGNALSTALEVITSGDAWAIFEMQAEKAILSIQTSGAMNGLAATLNTIFDGITASYKDNFNFGETFDKYMNAGVEANTEIIDGLDQKIAEIMSSAKNRAEGKRAAAASEPAAPFSPVIIPPSAITAAVEVTKESRDWESSSYEVDSYQRRGLSLDGGSIQQITKQESLLSQIRDVLKSMERNPAGAVF